MKSDIFDTRYGKWTNYSQQKITKYPDFIFEVSNSDESVLVKWSEGTGNIDPVSFSIGEQSFLLEMLGSSILKNGYVDEENIVIWPEKEWERRQ